MVPRGPINRGSSRDPPRDGGPGEAADYVAAVVVDLAVIAQRHGLETLSFLLDMAKMEAEEIARQRQR